jgi:hypothetical protein
MKRFARLKQIASRPSVRRIAGVLLLLVPGGSVFLVLAATVSFLGRRDTVRIPGSPKPLAVLSELPGRTGVS